MPCFKMFRYGGRLHNVIKKNKQSHYFIIACSQVLWPQLGLNQCPLIMSQYLISPLGSENLAYFIILSKQIDPYLILIEFHKEQIR